MILSGVVTAMPLLMFAAAARRLRYTTIGLLQFMSPSLQFAQAESAYLLPNFSSTKDGGSIAGGQVVFSVSAAF